MAEAATEAARIAREQQRPALLHLRTVRFLGHAGTDVESGYRTPADILADRARDPLLALARSIGGVDLLARYDDIATEVAALADEVDAEPKLTSGAQVVAPLAPPPAGARRRPRMASRAPGRRWRSASTRRWPTRWPPVRNCSSSARTSAARAACTG